MGINEVIGIAQACGFEIVQKKGRAHVNGSVNDLHRFSALIAEEERQANIDCIGLILADISDPVDRERLFTLMKDIRARGQS